MPNFRPMFMTVYTFKFDWNTVNCKNAASDFNFLLDGGAGVLNTSTSTISNSNVAGHAGAALKYNFTPTLSWTTVRLESLFTPGQPVRIGISTGLALSLTKAR